MKETIITTLIAGPIQHVLNAVLSVLVAALVMKFNKLTGIKFTESQAKEALHTDELITSLAAQCVHAVEDRWANAVNSEQFKQYVTKAEHAREMLKGRLAVFGVEIDDSHVADAIAAAFQREIAQAEKWVDVEIAKVAGKAGVLLGTSN